MDYMGRRRAKQINGLDFIFMLLRQQHLPKRDYLNRRHHHNQRRLETPRACHSRPAQNAYKPAELPTRLPPPTNTRTDHARYPWAGHVDSKARGTGPEGGKGRGEEEGALLVGSKTVCFGGGVEGAGIVLSIRHGLLVLEWQPSCQTVMAVEAAVGRETSCLSSCASATLPPLPV